MNWRKESQSLKEESDAPDLALRIYEIKTRIAFLRSCLESNDKPYKAVEVAPPSNKIEATSAAADLKAKLLARRK